MSEPLRSVGVDGSVSVSDDPVTSSADAKSTDQPSDSPESEKPEADVICEDDNPKDTQNPNAGDVEKEDPEPQSQDVEKYNNDPEMDDSQTLPSEEVKVEADAENETLNCDTEIDSVEDKTLYSSSNFPSQPANTDENSAPEPQACESQLDKPQESPLASDDTQNEASSAPPLGNDSSPQSTPDTSRRPVSPEKAKPTDRPSSPEKLRRWLASKKAKPERPPSPQKEKAKVEQPEAAAGSEVVDLQAEVTRLRQALAESNERLAAHDASAKKTIMSLQNDMHARLDNLGRLCDENRREKEAMVLKYAEAERKTMDVQRRVKDLEGRLREATREREAFTKQGRVLRQEKDRMQQLLDAKSNEVATLEKELVQSKDSASSVDMKVKWHQNKLKEEMDKHKETKKRLEEATKALRNAKEETETIRANCQQIVRQYQESEEMRSNSLDAQLKQKESELKQTQAENYVQKEVHQKALKDLEHFRKQAREATAELRTLRDKVKCLEAERMCQEESAAQAKERATRMKQQRDQLAERLRGLEAGAAEAAERAVELERLQAEAAAAAEARAELEAEVERAQGRESELLEFTQRLSNRNAALQAETLSQRTRIEELAGEMAAAAAALESAQAAGSDTERKLLAERDELAAEVERLTTSLSEKTRSVEELSVLLADEQNAIRTLKKKHAANTKDLTRQLAAAQRKIEARRSPLGGLPLTEQPPPPPPAQAVSPSNGDVHPLNHTTSPASSVSSLDLHTAGASGAMAVSVDGGVSEGLLDPSLSAPPEIKMIMPDRQALIDKIVRLQRQNARHNEKMDFLQEHVAQLTEQLKKKNRLLQHFILREEAGSVTPEDFDINKATLARKGGIMASVYSSHAADQGMTLDLSLEITKKLQAVLEDTLLKNITLKDNLNTLGEEISRLSRENRDLQLKAPSPT